MQIKAAVVRARSGPFAIETVEFCEPRPDEVIVRVVASGMCQTDLHGRDGYFGRLVSGGVRPRGRRRGARRRRHGARVCAGRSRRHVVSVVRRCAHCRRQRLTIAHARSLKSGGTRADGSTLLARNGAPVYSAFFQQSSFGTYALTQARLHRQSAPRCAARIIGSARLQRSDRRRRCPQCHQPNAGESLAVFGVGAVGLSALMAAKIAGCAPIVAVDVSCALAACDLARELGAHTRSTQRLRRCVCWVRAASAAAAFTMRSTPRRSRGAS